MLMEQCYKFIEPKKEEIMIKLKQTALLASLAAAGLVSSTAFAADPPPPPFTLTANVGLYSQYVFRGLTQTNEDPAIQGGFDFTHSSGFYLGTWASNISWLKENATTSSSSSSGTYKGGGSMEWDFYGGYRKSIGDFGVDVGLLQYYYPGSLIPGATKANTLEGYIAGSWKWFTLKYSQSLTNKTFGVADSKGTDYWDLSGSFPIGETGLTLAAHYGIQTYKGKDPVFNGTNRNNDSVDSYDDWRVSLAYDMGKMAKSLENISVGVIYTDTSSASCQGYGAYNETCNVSGTTATGAYPKNIAKSQTTVYISKTF